MQKLKTKQTLNKSVDVKGTELVNQSQRGDDHHLIRATLSWEIYAYGLEEKERQSLKNLSTRAYKGVNCNSLKYNGSLQCRHGPLLNCHKIIKPSQSTATVKSRRLSDP